MYALATREYVSICSDDVTVSSQPEGVDGIQAVERSGVCCATNSTGSKIGEHSFRLKIVGRPVFSSHQHLLPPYCCRGCCLDLQRRIPRAPSNQCVSSPRHARRQARRAGRQMDKWAGKQAGKQARPGGGCECTPAP